ncbi:hypothetical protein BP00DRAFT_427169 [Aspergillus indologenus CBS 114.80]|uniref:Uncharacterized protein n=1 Tax=Aspergillus indologenus CBS 114.80 TaxID=1450541 RepID=A0A2V5I6U1_9EURO|nr:hypothetical protein BP00DRAFT_427169 [Aspergillus indologenus CBS 114.80]
MGQQCGLWTTPREPGLTPGEGIDLTLVGSGQWAVGTDNAKPPLPSKSQVIITR